MGDVFFKIQYLSIFSFPCVWFEISSYFSTLKLYSEVLLVCHMNRDKQSTICTLLFDFMILIYFIFFFISILITKKNALKVKMKVCIKYILYGKDFKGSCYSFEDFYFVRWGKFMVYIILILFFNHANILDQETNSTPWS